MTPPNWASRLHLVFMSNWSEWGALDVNAKRAPTSSPCRQPFTNSLKNGGIVHFAVIVVEARGVHEDKFVGGAGVAWAWILERKVADRQFVFAGGQCPRNGCDGPSSRNIDELERRI